MREITLTELAVKLQNPEELLSPIEASVFLRCSRFHLANLRVRGEGPKYVKLGGRIYYRPKDLKKYIEESVVDPYEAS